MELRSTYEADAPFHNGVKSIEMLPNVSNLILIFVVVVFALATSLVALIRVPTSLVMIGAFVLTVLASANLVRWWRRNSGTIAMTSEELIVTPRSGPVLRRYLNDIHTIQRSEIKVYYLGPRWAIDKYVRIFSDGEIPLEFVWPTTVGSKKANPADRFVSNLQTRLPSIEVSTKLGPPEKLKVAHARRGSKNNGGASALFAIVVCGFGGLILNVLVPKSSSSAEAALRPLEGSLASVRRTPMPGDSSSEVFSTPCFGQNGGGSYWEEDFFNLEIRSVDMKLAVNANEKTVEARARQILPKGWTIYTAENTPNEVGNTTLYLKSPCLTAKHGQFYPALEARFTTVAERLRTKVNEP
jgi:hypothetical protein